LLIFVLFGCASQDTYDEPSVVEDGMSESGKAEVINDTLFLADMFVLLYIKTLKKEFSLLETYDDEIFDCIKQSGSIVIGDTVAAAIRESLSKSELDEGFQKAYSLIFLRTTKFIKNNFESMFSEYTSLNKRYNLSDYLLIKASQSLGFSETERQRVFEFVTWHEAVNDRIVENSRMDSYLLSAKLENVHKECKKSTSTYKSLYR
jgi:hypothetical protein